MQNLHQKLYKLDWQKLENQGLYVLSMAAKIIVNF